MVALKEAHAKPSQEPVKPEVTTTDSLPVTDQRGAWLFAAAWEIHQRRHRTNFSSPLSKTSLFCAMLLLEDDIRKAAESAGLRTTDFFSIIGFLDESLPDHLPTPPPDLQLTNRLTAILANYRSHLPTGSALDRLALAHLLLSDPGGPLPDRLLRAGAERMKVNDVLEQTLRQGLVDRLVSLLRFRRDHLVEAVGGEDAHDGPSPIGRFVALGSKVTATDHLNRQGLVEALAAMLEDPQQETPLTIALLGDWGSGKSTLMALLRKRLDEGRPRRFCFADFNAWEYELTDNMAAGLAQEVVTGLADDTRLALRWPRRPSAEPVREQRERRPLHLSRWLSPGFWWLFGGFVLRRHGMRLATIALLVVALGWALRSGLLTPQQIAPENEDLQEALALAGALGGVAALLYLLRGAKHVLEHPFAIGLKTYLRLPRYEQHLGLVPVIKREIETLAWLWLGRGMVRRRVAARLEQNDLQERFPWLDRWSRPRRLVVFVDDLDRCSHARIGQTLDAIRLVMDVPQVVVVLGIDPRIALQAMALQYKDFAEAQRSEEEIARDYLGKIIQVPIRLRRPSPGELDQFVHERLFAGVRPREYAEWPVARPKGLDHRATPRAAAPTESRGAPADPTPVARPTPGTNGAPSEGNVSQVGASAFGGPNLAVGEEASPQPVENSPAAAGQFSSLDALRRDLAETMRPDDNERRTFQELVRAFGFHNPRQLIRLFNSYSLLKLFAATRAVAGDPRVSREELMKTLFIEELLHETAAPQRVRLESLLSTDSEDGSSSELAKKTQQVKDAVVTTKAREVWSLLGDRPLRDFVQLVVLPASAEDSATDDSTTKSAR